MKHARIITLGCKTNQTEGDMLRRGLAAMGFQLTEEGTSLDLVVVNTCTVTVRADRKCRQLIRQIARRHPAATIYVTGCYVRRSAEQLASLEGVSAVSAEKRELLDIIARREHVTSPPTPGDLPPASARRARAMLKIQDGCDAFCSYCIVPYVRPTLHSEPIDRILDEARRLVDAGFREIVLTGIHIGRYGVDRDDGVTLLDVIRRVAEMDGLRRLRLSSIEMFDVADELIDMIAASHVICPHLHLPLQSGDDAVLRAMNRRYTSADVLASARRIRKRIPDVSITTDVIAGFPGETDAAFENTMCVCREVAFSRMHVFPYSVRPGTRAAELPTHLPARVITGRKKRLITLADELALACKQRFLGKTVDVLVESVEERGSEGLICEGLTEYYMRVRFGGDVDCVGQIVPVEIDRVTPQWMLGRRSVQVDPVVPGKDQTTGGKKTP